MKKTISISGMIMAVIFILSCKKNENVRPPEVITKVVSEILYKTATAGGAVTDDGGASSVIKGVCWGVNTDPTIDDSLTIDGTGFGEYVSYISGLKPGKTYYYRAYAANKAGTAYGEQFSFKTHMVGVNFNSSLTYGIMTDIDGHSYKTIPIGSQVWMAQNLRTTKLKDGTEIPLVTGRSSWSNQSNPAFCWFDNDEAFYGEIYGAYYNWFAVNTGKLCPTGWHVPSDAESQLLVDFLGGINTAGAKLKEVGVNNWVFPNKTATNSSGFTALPAGIRGSIDGLFGGPGAFGGWWTTKELTPSPLSSAWCYWIHGDTAAVTRSEIYKMDGFPVRCIKD
jgi:uncharacterized protein (TIGR02145 family)